MNQMTEPMGPTGPTGGGDQLGSGPIPRFGPMGSSIVAPAPPVDDAPGAAPSGPPIEQPEQPEQLGSREPISLQSMARVDLLPLEIVQNRNFAKVRRGVVALVVVAVLVAAAGAVWARSGVAGAQQGLEAAQSAQQSAVGQQAKYTALPKLEAQLNAAKAARVTAMGQDVLFYRLLNDLKASLPAGLTLGSINVTLSSAATTAAASSATSSTTTADSALTPAGIGAIQLSGTATSYSQLATWLDSAGSVAAIGGVTLTGASETEVVGGGTSVSFTATAVLTPAALSNRYTKES